MKDEVISELWAIKDEIAKAQNYDVDALFEYFRSPEQPKIVVSGAVEG